MEGLASPVSTKTLFAENIYLYLLSVQIILILFSILFCLVRFKPTKVHCHDLVIEKKSLLCEVVLTFKYVDEIKQCDPPFK